MPGRAVRLAAGAAAVVIVCIVAALLLTSGSPAARHTNDMDGSKLEQRMAVPAYIDPTSDPAAWAQLTGSKPGVVGIVVANVDNGPGAQPVPAWSAAIRQSHEAGSTVLGYVDTGYLGRPNGTRPEGLATRSGSTGSAAWLKQIEGDIEAWYQYYGSDIGGIFMDESPSECGPTAYSTLYADEYRVLSEFVRRQQPGAVTALNPGTAVGQCFQDSADVLVTFEGSYQAYTGGGGSPTEAYRPLGWASADPGKIWHIIYGASSEGQLRHALALSRSRNAGYVYVTDAVPPDPFDRLPSASYWSVEQAAGPESELRPSTG